MKRKVLSIFVVLAMVLSVLPMGVFAAESEGITYIDRTWDDVNKQVMETEKVCTDFIIVDENTTTFEDGKWYVTSYDVNDHRITVSGTANLILTASCTFTVNGGIYVPKGNTLNIYGQKGDSGALTAFGPTYSAAIGGNSSSSNGTVNIHGGNVTATGGDCAAAIGGGKNDDGGNVTVFGGNVTAKGGIDAAAIGGGWKGYGGNLNIFGGNVTAISGGNGRAIGAGYEGGADGNITVADYARVKAGDCAPGADTTLSDYIQNGYKYVSISASFVNYIERSLYGENVVQSQKSCTDFVLVDEDTVTFEDGKWYAVKGNVVNDHRITLSGTANLILCDNSTFNVNGGIFVPLSNTLNIYGQLADNGKLTAFGPAFRAAIGSNSYMDGGNVNIHGGIVTAMGGDVAAAIGGGYKGNGGNVTIFGGNVMATSGGDGRAIGAGYEGDADGNITVAPHATVKAGDTAPGNDTTLADYIQKGYKYVSIAVPEPEPMEPIKYIERTWDAVNKTIVETEKEREYFIVVDENTTIFENGKWYVVNSAVTNKNRIEVKGTANLILCNGATLNVSDGIDVPDVYTLNIYAQSADEEIPMGKLIASNNYGCAGIGGGLNDSGGTVTIYGGDVTATCKKDGAGIGGGLNGSGGIVTIYGGTVTANGSNLGAGIGGGFQGDGGDVTIYGGDVTASGGYDGVGIGGGFGGNAGMVMIGDNMAVYDDGNHLVALSEGSSWGDLLNGMKYIKIAEKDSLALEITGNSFTVTASGKDAGTGIVMVALYDNENTQRLAEVKVFDLSKGDIPQGTFTQSGYVKAFWWTDLETMTPLCNSVCGTIE